MKEHYEIIDIIKGIAIILVILGHGIIFFPINLQEIDWCRYLFYFVSIAHMQLFFLASGFCFNYENKTYKKSIKSKFFRILLPYIIFSMIDLIPRICLQFFVNRPTNLFEGINKVLFYGGEYWFLYVLFIIFMIYPLIFKYISKNNKIYNIIILFLVLCMRFIKLPHILLIDTTILYLFFFMLGNLLKENISYFAKLEKKITIQMNIVIEIIIFGLMVAYSINLDNIENTLLSTILIQLLGSYFWYLIAKYIMQLNKHVKKFIEICGKYSLQLYLFNGFFLVMSRTLLVNVLKFQNPVIIILGNTIFPISFTLLITIYIIDKFKFLKVISGLK